jgi:hypothetical protein
MMKRALPPEEKPPAERNRAQKRRPKLKPKPTRSSRRSTWTRHRTSPDADAGRDLDQGRVRAHSWRRRIESAQAKSITDLAEQKGVTAAYICRLLPLTCLAPDIVAAILDGRQSKGLRLAQILGNTPLVWEDQRRRRSSNTTAIVPLLGPSAAADGRNQARLRGAAGPGGAPGPRAI